ncbi:MAG: Wzz/FepE/Etk N-terminal domain-containing protein [Firmicutes bacterium]|nr:Wzz/FepE/Etk N-terminal domain-containing protein [Bacillota bacterium]
MELRDYLTILRRRKGVAILIFLITISATYIGSKLMVPVYRATTTIVVEDNTQAANPFRQIMPEWSKKEELSNLEVLKSRTLMAQVVKDLQLPFDTASKRFTALRKAISVQQVPDAGLFRIQVDLSDPKLARDVANVLVEAFERQTQMVNREEARSAREFIKEQLEISEQELLKSENELARFKEKESLYSPADEIRAAVDRIARLETSRLETGVALKEAEARLAKIQIELGRQSQDIRSSTTLTSNPVVEQFSLKLANLEVELAAALEKYTEKHPAVLALRTQIDQTKKRMGEEMRQVVSSETRSVNPVYQQLMQEAVRWETERVMLKVRYDTLTRTISENESAFAGLSEKELKFARLSREAKTAENIFSMLKEKYEEVRITEATRTSGVRVVDSATLPEKPIKPRIGLNLIIAAFLGAFLGVWGVFLLEYLDTTIKTSKDAEEATGLPVLGRIPVIPGNERKKHGW